MGAQIMREWLSFRLGEAHFALELARIREVVTLSEITRVPETPDELVGVVDLRGRPLPVVDVAARLGATQVRDPRWSCVLVVDTDAGPAGLLVERVERLIDVEPAQIEESRERGLYGQVSVAGRRVALVDLQHLLRAREERA